MMKFIFLTLFISSCGLDHFKSGTETSTSKISTTPTSCLCTTSFNPVCGKSDNKSYDNACLAKCFGNETWSTGNCTCSNEISVCGIDGKNYSECEAKKQNVNITKFVPCEALEN